MAVKTYFVVTNLAGYSDNAKKTTTRVELDLVDFIDTFGGDYYMDECEELLALFGIDDKARLPHKENDPSHDGRLTLKAFRQSMMKGWTLLLAENKAWTIIDPD